MLVPIEMIANAILSDLCYTNPLDKCSQVVDVAIQQQVEVDTAALTTISYYMSCAGVNLLGAAVGETERLLQLLVEEANRLNTTQVNHTCAGGGQAKLYIEH